MKGAWVTLATNDSYSLGALVLAHSLKQVGTTQELALLVTPGVTSTMRSKLSEVFNVVLEVNLLDSKDKANLKLLQRPELGVTFTKLHCWRLTQYEKCVFLDADTLVLKNCDELFEREELSAAPDVGWPDCFNSGVFVYKPSDETYDKLIQFALDKGSFDGGDQGLLNLYFSDWSYKDISKHLPFIYNVCSTAFYSYLPAFKQFGKDAKIIHFIGNAKPWLQYFDSETRRVRPSGDLNHLEVILQKWWDIFCTLIHPNLSSDMTPSYPETVSRISPRQSPQRPHTKPQPQPIVQTYSSYESQNTWDPWEEYDRKQNASISSPKPYEPHNTNAFSPAVNEYSEMSSGVFNTPLPEISSDRSYQEHFTKTSEEFEPSIVEQSHSEPQTEYSNEEKTFRDNSHEEGLFCNESYEEFRNPSYSANEFFETPPSNQIQDAYFQNEPPITPKSPDKSSSYDMCKDNATNPPKCDSFDPSQNIPSEPSLKECEGEINIDSEQTEQETKERESGLAGAFAKLTLGQRRSSEQEALEDSLRRQNWEQGNIDYLGKDSFDNIWSKICETLAKGPQAEPEEEQVPAVVQPEKSDPKLIPEKPTPAAVPQEVQSETPGPIEAEQKSTEPSVEKAIAPSESPNLTDPSVSVGPETLVSTQNESPCLPVLEAASPANESVGTQVCSAPKETVEAVSGPILPHIPPVDSVKAAAATVVETPAVAASQTQSVIVEASSESSSIASKMPIECSAIAVGATKVAPEVTQEPSTLPGISSPVPLPDQPLCILPSQDSLVSNQNLFDPQQPTAPAAELVVEPQACPLPKTEGTAPVVSQASITGIPEASDSAQPISEQVSAIKLQTRATSVQIPADTLATETQSSAVPELPEQVPTTEVPTSATPVQAEPNVPVTHEKIGVPSPQPPLEASPDLCEAPQIIAQAAIPEITPTSQAPTPVSTDQPLAATPIAEVKTSAVATETPEPQTSVVEHSTLAPKEQIPAPTAEISKESSPPQKEPGTDQALAASKPGSTCPQSPIAPPPRKSGGNKKQGKPKK